MPPINDTFCKNCTNVRNFNPKEDDEVESSKFPYDLLLLIVPIGFLILFSLYIRIQCCIDECNRPRIENDNSSSIDSHSLTYSSVATTPEFIIQPKPSIFFIKDMKQCRVNNHLEVKDICSICLGPFEEHDLMVTMPCGHQYHKECVHPWLRQNIDSDITPLCPMCKSKLVVEYRTEVNLEDIGVIIEKNY